MFWNHLFSWQNALLLYAIFVLIDGIIYPALHTEPEGKRGIYVFPAIACLLVLLLLGAWVRAMFFVAP
jgi:hypothetical protein